MTTSRSASPCPPDGALMSRPAEALGCHLPGLWHERFNLFLKHQMSCKKETKSTGISVPSLHLLQEKGLGIII